MMDQHIKEIGLEINFTDLVLIYYFYLQLNYKIILNISLF